jgi:hypothetical protein
VPCGDGTGVIPSCASILLDPLHCLLGASLYFHIGFFCVPSPASYLQSHSCIVSQTDRSVLQQSRFAALVHSSEYSFRQACSSLLILTPSDPVISCNQVQLKDPALPYLLWFLALRPASSVAYDMTLFYRCSATIKWNTLC